MCREKLRKEMEARDSGAAEEVQVPLQREELVSNEVITEAEEGGKH